MAIRKPSRGKHQVDIDGPAGNAHALLGLANDLARQLGYDREKRNAIHADMTSSDYAHLIKTFDREFGDFVDLITDNPSLIGS